jgi:hypothetical protein
MNNIPKKHPYTSALRDHSNYTFEQAGYNTAGRGTYYTNNLLFRFSIPEKQRVQKQAWPNSRINAST